MVKTGAEGMVMAQVRFRSRLQFGLLELILVSIVGGVCLFAGIYIERREREPLHRQRLAEMRAECDLQVRAAVERERSHLERWVGSSAFEEMMDSNLRSILRRSHDTAPEALPEVPRKATFKRMYQYGHDNGIYAAVKDARYRQLIERNLGAETHRTIWKEFVDRPYDHFLPLCWYAEENPEFYDYLTDRVNISRFEDFPEATGFLSWSFSALTPEQKQKFLGGAVEVDFDLKNRRQDVRLPFDTVFTIQTRDDGHYGSHAYQLHLDRNSALFIDGKEFQNYATSEAYVPLTLNQPLSPKWSKRGSIAKLAAGEHRCRIVLKGYFIDASATGAAKVASFEKDTGEFTIIVNNLSQNVFKPVESVKPPATSDASDE
jgi:hypothetical protein